MDNDQNRSAVSYKQLAKTWEREAPQQFGMMLEVLSTNGVRFEKKPGRTDQRVA